MDRMRQAVPVGSVREEHRTVMQAGTDMHSQVRHHGEVVVAAEWEEQVPLERSAGEVQEVGLVGPHQIMFLELPV